MGYFDPTAFGAALKSRRLRAGMTQEEVGTALGLGPATARVAVCRLESGSATPSMERLFELAYILDCEPGELLT